MPDLIITNPDHVAPGFTLPRNVTVVAPGVKATGRRTDVDPVAKLGPTPAARPLPDADGARKKALAHQQVDLALLQADQAFDLWTA